MHSFVITRAFRSATALVQRRIVTIRTIAYFGSILGVLGVSVAVALSTGTPQQTAALAVLGSTLAATPYVIARAVEELVNGQK